MSGARIPPQDEQAEASILGAILIDKDALADIIDFLKPEFFYKDIHNFIFTAMIALFEKHEPVDIVTVTSQLKKIGKYKEIGGSSYLSDLTNLVPTSANIQTYARIVADHYIKRKLIETSARLAESAFDDKADAKLILDKAESEILSIALHRTHKDFIHVKDALAESFDRLDELHKRGSALRGLATGFSDLDNKLAGLQDSNLIILAARPGQGKTAFAVNIAQNIAVNLKLSVGIFSLEMSKEELVDRLLVSQADVDAWRLKTGKLDDNDFTKLSEAMGELAEAPIFIDDTPGLNLFEIRTKARRLQVSQNVRLIIVDYLQLIDPGRRMDNRVQEVSMISQSLKNLARELKIPVIAVSQLSRAVEHRGEKKPQLADLRESGAIEQDADVVMFLYKENQDQTFEKWDQQIVKLLIAKHRNGPGGEIDLIFKGDRIRFYGVEKKRE
ncbi:replicative DNA helicase [Candidatus Gottesmanbacteria bacterium CG11_big_fil_rev_8_21_14_0_20_37_11]|uniref:Replicative DNA helicase n=2 Tax=Microgenomates group TaxID=1794810 RepID=A0A2H0NH04_9BACT|nr:MAG: replicative DNA helicase [Candidatus Gottesmanbacteria bacterium CG11_big_fil_rev_8_21_14_0_20_37_11]PJE60134.1 MAG: replicative DNA helicase [Candidatus Roizmanbacteria bacterium CG10_big_fil_rev_8_21_14_0_10_36_26]